MLDRLREEKAIEARGSGNDEPVQTVFDVSSGSFRQEPADGAGDQTATADGGTAAEDASAVDPDTEAVLDELGDLDVNETPPVELMAKVQEWQSQLDEE